MAPNSINPPDASRGISDDLVLLVWRSLPRLKTEANRDKLRNWIQYEAGRCSCVSWDCESLPPPAILQLPDLLEKLWGFERLLAYDVCRDFDKPSDLIRPYESFLERFYASNDRFLGKADDLFHEYLEKKKTLATLWGATEHEKFPNIPYDEIVGEEYLSGLLKDAEKEIHPYLAYFVYYLTKETELITEWLMKGYNPSDVQYNIVIDTQNMIMEFARLESSLPSVHTAAVLLGIIKEVEFLLDRASNDNLDPITISTTILGYALEYLSQKLCEFETDANRVTSAVEVNKLTGTSAYVDTATTSYAATSSNTSSNVDNATSSPIEPIQPALGPQQEIELNVNQNVSLITDENGMRRIEIKLTIDDPDIVKRLLDLSF